MFGFSSFPLPPQIHCMNPNTSDRWLIPLAFAAIFIIWGSTYLANWYAVRDIPPFLMSGIRFFVAGAVLFSVSFLFGGKQPSRAEWRATAECGFLFFLVGNGLAVWSLQFLDSGIAALIISSQPLVTVLLMWYMLGQKPLFRTIVGVGIGIVGMYLLVSQDQFVSNENALWGVGAIMVAVLSWGVASVRIAKLPLPKLKMQSAGMQMLLGGAMLFLVGLAQGEWPDFEVAKITTRGMWSMLYLITFGSIIAFSSFNYLLLKTTPDKVATNTYVNPIIALLLGWWLNGEVISSQSLFAAALMITGVVFITHRKRKAVTGKKI